MAALDKIIYQAGLDNESRPMVVLCACHLPDPSVVDYDVLLNVIMAQLEQFVENDYTVVMFSGGVVHKPGWRWLFKAYRRLNRRYKKNLKALYIVHPSTWPRLILSTMNAFISPKFGAKVHYIDNLSGLAKVVPLSQINIPAAVYQHNLKFESTITLPDVEQDHHQKVFGVPLERLMGANGENGLPKVVQDLLVNLTKNGLFVEGLFRRSPSSAMLKQVRAAYDRGNPVNLEEYDIHISAVLLKLFLRELPESIIPARLYPALQEFSPSTAGSDVVTVNTYIKDKVIAGLDQNNLILASEIFKLLRLVANQEQVNKMTAYNLAIVMTPNLVRHEDVLQEIAMSAVSQAGGKGSVMKGPLTLGTAVRVMIESYDEIF